MIKRLALLFAANVLTTFAAAQTAPRARITETLRLAATREDFPGVPRVYVGSKGQIVVALLQDHQLRFYDSAGRRIGSFGRRGQGPGEFMMIGTAGWVGDTLWVHDNSLRRTTFIDPSAKMLRTVALPAQMTVVQKPGDAPARMYGGAPAGFYADGSSLVGGFTMSAGPSGNQRASEMFIARMNASGAATHVYSQTPSSNDPRWMIEISGLGNPVPFRFPPQMAASIDGMRFATLWADVSGDTGSFTVTLMKSSGAIVFSRAYPFKGVPIPRRAIDSALAAFLPKAGQPTEGPSDLGQRFQAAAKSKIPAVYTPATGIIVGLDNTVWIPMRATPDGREILVLDGRGTPIGSVVLPPRTTLRQANVSTIWATQTDTDGLGSVVRYRITGITCGVDCQ